MIKDKLGRRRYEHKYEGGLPNAEIDLEMLKSAIEKCKLSLRKKAYVILLFWIGLRRSEPLVIKKEDIKLKDENLEITISCRKDEAGKLIPFSRLKSGLAGSPSFLSLSLYGVDLVREAWERTRKGRRLFPFSDKTGYRAVKTLFPKKSPHWLRHNRITKLRRLIDGKTIGIDDVKSFTGIKSDRTIEGYGMTTEEGSRRVSKTLLVLPTHPYNKDYEAMK